MAKKVMGTFKLQLKAGEATMAPPVGPAFGQRGLAGMEFVKQFNAKSAKQPGMILPVLVTFFSDKSFTFEIKSPPASILLLKASGLDKGSAAPHRDKVGKVNRAQLAEIAKIKMPDLYAVDMDGAVKTIAGTARSMGIEVMG